MPKWEALCFWPTFWSDATSSSFGRAPTQWLTCVQKSVGSTTRSENSSVTSLESHSRPSINLSWLDSLEISMVSFILDLSDLKSKCVLFNSDNSLGAWIKKYGWKEVENNMVFIANQDDNIKTKNITEKINFEDISTIMASCR
jgi:hypothetical protein